MSSSAAEYYEVQWRPQGSNAAWSAPAKCSPLGSIAVKGLPRGTQYEFQVRAVSNCGAKSVWVGSNYTVPAAPPPRQPLMPTPTGKSDGVALDWGDGTVPSGDVMYQIDRAPATGAYASAPPPEGDASWVRVATVSATNWTDSVTDTADYWYRVRAISFAGATSPWTVLNAPAKAIISTPEVSAQVDQARADITALDGQATQLRTDVDGAIAQVQVLQGQVGDILQADIWVATTVYVKGDLVQSGGQLFRSLIDGNLNHQPTASATDANWEYIGNYASLGEAVGANAANIATVQNTVTQQGNTIAANSQSISQQAAQIADKADASALQATNATVTQQGNDITAVAQDVALLGAHSADKSAFVLSQSTTKVDGSTTLGQYMSGVQAANNAVNARVDSEHSAWTNATAANANAITAVRAQTSGGDLVRKGVFDASLSVGGWSGGGLLYAMNDVNLGYCLAIVGNVTESPAIPVTPGDQYDITAKGYSGNIPNGAVLLFGISCTLLDGSINNDAQSNGLTNAAGIFTLNQRVTIPANAVTAAPFATVLYNNGSVVIFRDLHMTRVTAANNANASATQALSASVDAVTGKVNASWTVALDVNGRVSGIVAQNNGTVSVIDVLADRFSVSAPNGGASTVFSGGNWRVYDAAGTLRVRMGVW